MNNFQTLPILFIETIFNFMLNVVYFQKKINLTTLYYLHVYIILYHLNSFILIFRRFVATPFFT